MARKGKSPTPATSPRAKLTFERTFRAATVDEVWDLWTTKAGLESWWGPEGFVTKVSKLELRPGGKFEYAMTATDSAQMEGLKAAGLPPHDRRRRNLCRGHTADAPRLPDGRRFHPWRGSLRGRGRGRYPRSNSGGPHGRDRRCHARRAVDANVGHGHEQLPGQTGEGPRRPPGPPLGRGRHETAAPSWA